MSHESLLPMWDLDTPHRAARLSSVNNIFGTEFVGVAVPTSRLKTVQTLVGKLRREPHMNLSQVQDVAGVRIVRDMNLAEQSKFSERIAGVFAGSKTSTAA